MKKISLGFLACLALMTPGLLRAANPASQDYEDQGTALFNKGLYQKSIEYFQDAVQADSTNWQAYQDMGNAYAQLNQNQNAIDSYQRSLQINPSNQAVRDAITNLGGNPNAAPSGPPPSSPQANPAPAYDQGGQPTTVIIEQRPRRRRQPEPEPTYNDSLAPIDHAKFWAKLELGYDYSLQGDLVNSANTINNGSYNPANSNITGATSYTGSALASNSGLGWGGELGFLVNPNFGIGLGARYIQTSNYTADVQYNTGDQEHLTLGPSVVPITLDLYLFMPDHDGRFFISGGLGYYQGIVYADQKTTSNNFFGTPTSTSTTGPDEWSGNLYGGNIGFQLGLGREFAVNRHFGIEIYARGYYARITNFQGTLYDLYGNSQSFGLAASSSGPTVVDADFPQYIGGSNSERYATIDYTGFDVGASLNFYSF